ncbi:MAG: ATP-binding protein [Fervidobacterium sp.]|nr:ATP-binding protein [Fervidobacterium sp.]
MTEINISVVYIFLLLYNSIIAYQTLTVFARYKNKDIGKSGIIICLVIALYSFGYAMELLSIMSNDKSSAFLWYKIQYFAIPFISFSWYLFANAFAEKRIGKKLVVFLLIIPLLSVIAVWTNDVHNLYLKGYLQGGHYIQRGPLYYVLIVYNYVLAIIAYVKLFLAAKRLALSIRKVTAFNVLVAVLIPISTNIIYLALNLDIDLTIFGLMISVIILLYEAQKIQGFDIKEKTKEIVYNSTQDLILVINYDEIVIEFNNNFGKMAYEMFGRTDLKNKKLSEILPPEIVEVINKENGIIERDNRFFQVKVSMLEERGKLLGKIIFFHEITDLKRLENEKLFENERYRRLFEFAPVGILVEDENGFILDANPEFCKLSSRRKEELLGNHVSTLAPKEDYDLVRKNIENIISGRTLVHTVKSIGKFGEEKYFELYETRIILPNSKYGILSIQKDITKQVITQQVVRNLAKYQQVILDLALNFINLPLERLDEEIKKAIDIVAKELKINRIRVYKFSKEGQFTSIGNWFYSNSSTETPLVSFDSSVVRGKELEELLLGKQFMVIKGKVSNENINKFFGENTIALITPIKLNNEIIGFISAASQSEREWTIPEKRIMLLLATLIANTEMKRIYEQELIKAKQKAEQANIAKSAFLASMSHEIRTPLNGIVGFTNLLKETNLDEKQRKYVETIIKSTEVLLGIINDILDLAKIESGKFQLEPIECNLKMEMQSSLVLYNAKAKEKNVSYVVEIDEKISECLVVDSLRIQQVMFNLINNAIKFTPAGGFVKVSIRKVSEEMLYDTIRFSVEDTGIGIPKEKLSKIFEPFEQADISVTRKYGGTGLGLSISQRIVNMMGSKINVESEEGKGSTFYFELKLKKCKKQESREYKEKTIRKYNAKVLVVEDYEINSILMAELLKRYGIVPDFAINGLQGVEMALKNDYDLIFMDILMPEMDGIEATKKIRTVKLDVPIVALTAHALKNVKEEVLSAGMNDYVTKPVKIEELDRILEKFCGHLEIRNSESAKKEETKINVWQGNKHSEIEEKIQKIKEDQGFDEKFMFELIKTFIDSTKQSIDNIRSSLSKNDFETAQREAHSIKGAARSLSFNYMGELAYELEKHAQVKDAGFDYEKCLKDIEEKLYEVITYYRTSYELNLNNDQ